MSTQVLDSYSRLVQLDLMMSGLRSKYPFQLNERAKYTQHQIQLYQANYCKKDGGANDQFDVVVVELI